MRTPFRLLIAGSLVCGCASKMPTGVVAAEPGQKLQSVPGPFAELGPETDPDTAIIKACPVVMGLPNAYVPVGPSDQNFKTYWNVSAEYCAWQYSPDGRQIWTSLFATSAVQSDPSMRTCDLPPRVVDSRYPGAEMLLLTVIHNHVFRDPPDNKLSTHDFDYLDNMVGQHHTRMAEGAEDVVFPEVNGKPVPMRVVAFFGRTTPSGVVECAGFFEYTWHAPQVLRATQDTDGRWHKEPVGFPRPSDRN